jgi:hypothetical protein
MKPELAEKLGDARDFYSLTKAVLAMCEPYGPVHAFRLVHNRGAARVACLIELESPKQQPALARALGAKVLNGAACLEIPVDRTFGVRHAAEKKVVAIASFEPKVATS